VDAEPQGRLAPRAPRACDDSTSMAWLPVVEHARPASGASRLLSDRTEDDGVNSWLRTVEDV